MKILSVLNISNKENITCDSGYIFQAILAEEFNKNGHEYIVAGSNCKQFRKVKIPHTKKVYLPLGTNKYSARFDFDSRYFYKLLDKIKPDIIFNTQAELTPAIKSVLAWNKLNIPVVTYCHYPALWANKPNSSIPELDQSLNSENLCTPILMNILSALQISDAFIIQSKFAKELLEKAATFHNIKYKKNRFFVIAPPADEKFLEYIYTNDPDRNFVYNHRLYKTYGTEKFITIFKKLNKKYGVNCSVLDPMQKRSKQRSAHNNTPAEYLQQMAQTQGFIVERNNRNRNEYKRILSKSLAGFAPLRPACVWSMAAMDCMGLGIPVIAPNMAAFPEFIPQKLLYKNQSELENIVKNIIEDSSFRQSMSRECFNIAKKYSAKNITCELESVFKQILDKRCTE